MIRRITPLTLNKMKHLLHDTKEKELGFPLCMNTKDYWISHGEICKGEECTIQVSHNCNKDEKFVGKYHTHVDNEGDNIQDLLGYYGWGFGCYGRKPDKITCYQRIGSLNHDIFKNIKTIRDELDNTTDKLINLYASRKITQEQVVKLHDDMSNAVRKKFYPLFKINEL